MVNTDEIRKIANDRNLSIKELERRAGVANGSVGKWSVCSPMVASLEKIAATLGVPVSKLIEGD